LRGIRFLVYLLDMFRLLRSVRVVFYLARRINQRFLKAYDKK
jgi:hypothetical protein